MRLRKLCALGPDHTELPKQMVQAAKDGDAFYVSFCAEAKVDVDVQDKLLVTPLIAATIANKVSVVNQLLKLKADPRVQDCNGATCVHYAVQLNHVHALAAILDHPGNSDAFTIRDTRDRTAIDYARGPQRDHVLRLLRNRFGGPTGLMYQVVRGRTLDWCGVPRTRRAWEDLWDCGKIAGRCMPEKICELPELPTFGLQAAGEPEDTDKEGEEEEENW